MTQFLEMVVKKVKVPIMLDSTDHKVLEESLKRTQGKSIINSINLEDGEERFQKVVPLARTFGAALVVGCIDEDKAQAQAITRERKLAIAERSHEILTSKYGVAPEDIIFDALVFPVGTGDQNYIGSGVETIEGIRLIKEQLPRCKTILGVSNVSFGLPPARARGAELGLPLPLRAGRPRHGDRQLREARALFRDSRGGAEARRGPDLVARRGPDRRLRGPLPRAQGQADGRGVEGAAARRAAGALHPRRLQGGPLRRSRRGAAAAAARSPSSMARSWPAWTRSVGSSTGTS